MPYAGHKWGASSLGSSAGEISWSFTDFAFAGASYEFFKTTGSFRTVIERAFDAWEAVASIDFTEVTDAFTNDIRIGFGTLDGDAGSIAGQCTTFFSSATISKAEIAIDVDEPWVARGDDFVIADGSASFLAVAIHEIGHALGLDHEDSVPSIMSTFANPELTALTAADIALIRTIYGVPAGGGSNSAPTITQGSALSVAVNENGRAVTQLTGSDADGDPLNWSINGGSDAALFTIDAASGALQFIAAPDFETPRDAGRDNVYTVTVALSDGSASDTIDLTIGVNDVGGVTRTGGGGRDTLSGGRENDVLNGGANNDVLRGEGGQDRLLGGKGADTLFGGRDNATDRFIFAKSDSGTTSTTRDKLVDFKADTDGRSGSHAAGSDLIDLSRIDADAARGDQALRFVSSFTKAVGSQADGQVKVVDAGANLLVEIDLNGDNRADMSLLVLAVARLTADDFIL